ncbi:hypothetical protein HZB97_01250 [Candidatus Gottesmanbacteria bacterium]|nr:hypothetical protein [Candidatus Gottesmanbacteria bacterium]
MEEQTKEELVRPLVEEKKVVLRKPVMIVGAILVILLGVVTGFLLSQKQTAGVLPGEKPKVIKTEKVVGSTDTKTFPDQAEGKLEQGGADGEGTHKLVRNPIDPSQTAYLTSSIINLDDYVGKKIRVWGQTFAGQKAGSLMDVGRVELLE